jgi:hypothetical protein
MGYAEGVKHRSPGSAERRSRGTPPWDSVPTRTSTLKGLHNVASIVEPLQGSGGYSHRLPRVAGTLARLASPYPGLRCATPSA